MTENTTVENNEIKAEVKSSKEYEELLKNIWKELLGTDEIDVRDSFFDIGGHSLMAIVMVDAAAKKGINFTPFDLIEYRSISEIVKHSEKGIFLDDADSVKKIGDYQLLPHRHWFLARVAKGRPLSDLNHWIFSRMWDMPQSISYEIMAEALRRVVNYHGGLRMYIRETDQGWMEHINDEYSEPFLVKVDLSHLPVDIRLESAWQYSEELHKSISIFSDSTKFVWFEMGEGIKDRLLIYMHHLLIDATGYWVFAGDLWNTCDSLIKGEHVVFPRRSTSLMEFSNKLYEMAQSDSILSQLKFIESLQWDKASTKIPVDYPENADKNTFGLTKGVDILVDLELSPKVASLLQSGGFLKVLEISIASLIKAVEIWTGIDSLIVDTQFHERDMNYGGIDISRTVAGVTDSLAIPFDLMGQQNASEILRLVGDQLEEFRQKGRLFSALLYSSHRPDVHRVMSSLPRPEVSINLIPLGRGLAPPIDVNETHGYVEFENQRWSSPFLKKNHLIDLRVFPLDNGIKTVIEYCDKMFIEDRISEMAKRYKEEFVKMVCAL